MCVPYGPNGVFLTKKLSCGEILKLTIGQKELQYKQITIIINANYYIIILNQKMRAFYQATFFVRFTHQLRIDLRTFFTPPLLYFTIHFF